MLEAKVNVYNVLQESTVWLVLTQLMMLLIVQKHSFALLARLLVITLLILMNSGLLLLVYVQLVTLVQQVLQHQFLARLATGKKMLVKLRVIYAHLDTTAMNKECQKIMQIKSVMLDIIVDQEAQYQILLVTPLALVISVNLVTTVPLGHQNQLFVKQVLMNLEKAQPVAKNVQQATIVLRFIKTFRMLKWLLSGGLSRTFTMRRWNLWKCKS